MKENINEILRTIGKQERENINVAKHADTLSVNEGVVEKTYDLQKEKQQLMTLLHLH